MNSTPFKIDTGRLQQKPKEDAQQMVDDIADTQGFIARDPGKKRGRRASPRTAQLNSRVYPFVFDEITDRANDIATTKGAIIEAAWDVYKKWLNGDLVPREEEEGQ